MKQKVVTVPSGMGFLKAKCPQCWDSIPCDCPEQKEREASSLSSHNAKTHRLLREQNALLKGKNEISAHRHG